MDHHHRASAPRLRRIPSCARYELIHLNRLRYCSRLPHTSVGDITESARGFNLFFLTSGPCGRSRGSFYTTVAFQVGRLAARAREDALFLEFGSKRPLTVIASFPMGPCDSARRMTYVATDRDRFSHETQNLAIRHLGRMIYFEIVSIGAVRPISPSHRELLTREREHPLERWEGGGSTRRELDDPHDDLSGRLAARRDENSSRRKHGDALNLGNYQF